MEAEEKQRTVRILKAHVYKDIDNLTYKYAEGSSIPTPRQENAYSSDSMDTNDGHILARNVEYRDARLRTFMRQYLKESAEEIFVETDALDMDNDFIDYVLILPAGYKDVLLKSLATYIHRYLVWGALFDWYGAGLGSAQASAYQRELDMLEAEITNTLNAESVVKRPMQPFGPAKRFL